MNPEKWTYVNDRLSTEYMNDVIRYYNNPDLGIQSEIRKSATMGFAVQLRDTEAQEYLPHIRYYEELKWADLYARAIAGVIK